MSPVPQSPIRNTDAALIADVVRRVLMQLKSQDLRGHLPVGPSAPRSEPAANASPLPQTDNLDLADRRPRLPDSVISLQTLQRLEADTSEAIVLSTAVITPAAWDEAKQRGILLTRTSDTSASKCRDRESTDGLNHLSRPVSDLSDDNRGMAVRRLLAGRGIDHCGEFQVLLSDRPAADAADQAKSGRRVVVLRGLADVDRFVDEVDADVFVIDMVDVNLVAAVNIIARLERSVPRQRDRPQIRPRITGSPSP